jgi:enediyne biosynthesis protein E4
MNAVAVPSFSAAAFRRGLAVLACVLPLAVAADPPADSSADAIGARTAATPEPAPAAAPPAATAFADGGVRFRDLAADPASGLASYRRVPSTILETQTRYEALPAMGMSQLVAMPEKARGAPGVALLDHDGDGDLDVYVTNGPGAANSLFSSRLVEEGALRFVDVAEKAGVAARDQDSTGVCFGDVDNDGDPDLYVLGRMEPNRLFENRGDGTFRDVTEAAGLGGGALGHTSCSMGDVDGDGRLDIAVANSFDWGTRAAIFAVPFDVNHPNQLFRNLGGNRFADVSAASGILEVVGLRAAEGEELGPVATLTWAIALVDVDGDGDLDLLHADDQAAVPLGVADRAHVHVFLNDGTGRFENVTRRAGTNTPGDWMGLAFADFDCDGHLDFFATNLGDWGFSAIGIPYEQGQWSSRWFLGRGDGTFEDPGLGELAATPFGWSATAPDYDNDGDPDIVYFGSLGDAIHAILSDNPGAVLNNDECSARFRRDAEALAVAHNQRVVEGAASGDLDGNGFPDLVSVSSFDLPEELPETPYLPTFGSPFDPPEAVYHEYYAPASGGRFVSKGVEFPEGRLVVEVNDGANGNAWVAVRLRGSVGEVPGGRVNRDGIGGVIRVTPEGGRTAMRPVVGGAGYASQDALEATFGLGHVARASVEVAWPGGARNRLDGVRRGERLLFPEIPCDFAGEWKSEAEYRGCVDRSLATLTAAGVLDEAAAERFRAGALAARDDQPRVPRLELARPAGGEAAEKGGAKSEIE